MKDIDGALFSPVAPAQTIRNTILNIPASGGLYIQYIDVAGLIFLQDVQITNWETYNTDRIGMVYIGKSSDIQKRLRWYLGIINVSHSCICHGTLSTLRHSYMANNTNINCLSQQEALDSFIDRHIYISYAITEQQEAMESALLKKYAPPLNIQGNSNPFVKTNKRRRKAIKDAYRMKFGC